MHLAVLLTRVRGPDPPYDHNFLLGSAFYNKLQKFSEEAANALHDSYRRSAYVLSEIHRVRGKPREAWFRVGTSHTVVARIAGQALTPGAEIRVGPTLFQVTGLTMEEPIVRPGEYVTLSPILLTDKETGKSLVHDSDGYAEALEAAVNAQVKKYLKGGDMLTPGGH